MRLRLALAASVTALAAGPFAGASHAFACNEQQFPEFCAAYYFACRTTNTCRLFS